VQGPMPKYCAEHLLPSPSLLSRYLTNVGLASEFAVHFSQHCGEGREPELPSGACIGVFACETCRPFFARTS
jgi:hypothetical protein